MKAYLKRFLNLLLVAAICTALFLGAEIMLSKTWRLFVAFEWPVLSGWTYYTILMVFVCAVIAFFKP